MMIGWSGDSCFMEQRAFVDLIVGHGELIVRYWVLPFIVEKRGLPLMLSWYSVLAF
jgi:hypothetical protein